MSLEEATLYLQWGPSPQENVEAAYEKLSEARQILEGAVGKEQADKIAIFDHESYLQKFVGGFCE